MGTKSCRTCTCLSGMEFGDRYKRNNDDQKQTTKTEITMTEGDGHFQETLPLKKDKEEINTDSSSDSESYNMDFDDEGNDTLIPSNNPLTKNVHTSEILDTTKNTEKLLESIVMNENDQNIEHAILQRYSTHKFAQDQNDKEPEPEPEQTTAETATDSLKIEINSEKKKTGNGDDWEQDQVIYLEKEMKKQFLNLSRKTSETEMNAMSATFSPVTMQMLQNNEDNKLKKSNIYRQHSPNEWDTEQVEQHENEIKEELLNLSKNISHLDMDTLTSSLSIVSQEILSPAQEEEDDEEQQRQSLAPILSSYDYSTEASEDDGSSMSETPKPIIKSNLFRNESEQKWNNPLIDKQKKEMSKQLIHLAKQHKDSLIKQNDEFIFI